MKRVKHLALAAIITFALASPALAGNMPTGIAGTIPTGVSATMPTEEGGNMPTGVTFSEQVVMLIALMIS